MNKREIGTKNEETAIAFLVEHNVEILTKNYRCKSGEIDIIGKHNGYLVFFEVKYRTNLNSGDGAEAVGMKKQKIICRVADFYRYCNGITEYSPIRYDVISIINGQINWYQNAFYHIFK